MSQMLLSFISVFYQEISMYDLFVVTYTDISYTLLIGDGRRNRLLSSNWYVYFMNTVQQIHCRYMILF
jgi:hypothetical protein